MDTRSPDDEGMRPVGPGRPLAVVGAPRRSFDDCYQDEWTTLVALGWTTVRQAVAIVEGAGRRGWAVEVTTSTVEVFALDEAGTVIDRCVIGERSFEMPTETSVVDDDPPV